jgi:hypothetical protein
VRPSEIITEIRAITECNYIATEAFYHLWGKENGYTLAYLNRPHGGIHWCLEHRPSGLIIDLMADKFPTVNYETAVPGDFPHRPSRRAQQIIDSVLTTR